MRLLVAVVPIVVLSVMAPGRPARAEVKNVIVMIADGWGYNQIEAARYWDGAPRAYDGWAVAYAMSTYMFNGGYDPAQAWSNFDYVRQGATDSAASATAMSTGTKTSQGRIGMNPAGQPLKHLIERAEELGRATGVVTSVEWSHATPAGFVAHNLSRYNYSQIAQEMVHSSAVDVIMGAGHPLYDRDGDPVPGGFEEWQFVGGEATWNALVAGTAGGDADGDGSPDPWSLVQTRQEFQDLTSGVTPARVLGTAQVRTTLQQERSGGPPANDPQPPYTVPLLTTVPTLEEMTRAALNILDDDPDGLFLVVEGGAVDWANHDRQLGRMIEELNDFDDALDAVISWVDSTSHWGETLVIVTGDHETGFLWGPGSGPPDVFNPVVDNGPGSMPGFWYYSSGHTNSLIPLFAAGLGSDRFADHATGADPVRGAYLDNIVVADVVFGLFEPLTAAAPELVRAGGTGFEVGSPFPNPGKPSLHVRVTLARPGRVALEIFDLGGRRVHATGATMPAGTHLLTVDARSARGPLASGTYFLRVRHGDAQVVRKVSVIR